MGMKLFDGGDSDDENVSKIEINKEYARRFEHNKKREDLHRLQELKKKGLVGDDSSSESGDESSSESSSSLDDDVDVSKASKKDLDFFNALLKVRSRDPSLKEKNVALFESEDSDGDEEKESKDRKHKLYLKDVVAKQLIEEGPDFDDEQTEVTKKKSYSEEQEEMRRAFLEAAEAAEAAEVDGDGGDFLTVKRRDDGEPVEGGDGAEFQQKLDEYFGRSEALGENEMFLKEFFLNKMWVDKDKKSKGHVNEEELEELLRDEEEIEKQEDYETNFRYEENAGDRVLGHSRTIEGSVRKKETARKKQRESKEERMKIAEMERKEELKHLKNLKKEEMKQKLEKFKQIAGIDEDGDCPLDGVDLDDDFDPEEYDRMMKQVFNQKYYNADDVDSDFGSDRDEDGGEIEKPDFEKEDELLGLPVGWDESESKDGFIAARERSLRHKLNDGGEDDGDDDDDDDDDDEEEDGKVDGGASTSMYQTRPSVSIDNANDGAEYEVHEVEKKVVDGEGRSDAGGNASRFKGIGNVLELVREIEVQFERAAESGHEIARMLEVGKVPYKRKSQVSSRKAHGRTPSFSVVSAQPPSSKGAESSASTENVGPVSLGYVEEMAMRTGNLSSTLRKLHLWEKKLYNEVKAEEKMRVIHDRKVQRLKHLHDSGAENLKKESATIMIRSLSTKIKIAIQIVDKISITINKIRDEELWPQINELIEGLMRMWKCLLECHRNQCQAMKEAQRFGPIGSARKPGDASPETIPQFQRELINWANGFTTWVTAQKNYVKALDNWLRKCIFYEPEETPDGVVPFSPGRIGAPPIFVICHQWSQAMDRISEKEVVTAMFGFTSSVFQLREQDRMQNQHGMVQKEIQALDREDQKIQKEIQALEKKINRGSGNGDIPSVTGQLVYQKDVSNNLQAKLQRIFEAMERYTADSVRAYEELMQRIEEEIRIAQERVGVS